MKFLKLDDLISDNTTLALLFTSFKFNGGEQHICIKERFDYDEEVTIEVSLTDSAKIMQTFIATDALRRLGCKKINLFAPYLPYARQDRVCNIGEALSVKVMCDLINSQGYNKVWTLDNHSDVSTALLNNYQSINLHKILCRIFYKNGLLGNCALVSPDSGALKRVYTLAKQFGGAPVIECGKQRDVTTGNIVESVVYSTVYQVHAKKKLLIVDDICDGGKTFTELAKRLKEQSGAKNIELFVSHGIFSKGLEVFAGLIDRVYTTKSFKNEITDRIGESFETADL